MKNLLLAFLFYYPAASFGQEINNLKLKDFHPVSIYKIPITKIEKAKYPVIDFHSHDYPKSDAAVDEWVKTMNETGISKSIILSHTTGARFDSVITKYARYKDRFEIWCGFDYTGNDKPGWQQHALAELERCHKMGAKGVGELGDKGLGEFYSTPVPSGLHIDDPQMKPLLEKCADLHMPVSIHVAEDSWMYENIDSTNDGLMNAALWRVDLTKKGIFNHDQLVATLENAVKNNPKTIFIACHLANCCADLSKLERLLDKYPNLYADLAARFGEFSPVPRYTGKFMEKYQDRLLYGLDMDGSDLNYEKEMDKTTFRILESADEHFYKVDLFTYHWPLYGLSLTDKALQKIYSGNAKKIMKL